MAKDDKKRVSPEDTEEVEQEETEDNEFSEVEEEHEHESEDLQEDEKRVDDLTHQLTRLHADFKNFKVRAEREKQDYIQYGFKKMANEILPVLDNFELALKEMKNCEDPSMYDGVKMIYDQFIEVLNKYEIKKMEVKGEPFDPELHHAVFMEDSDEVESNHVVDVIQNGYFIKDSVLRPAMVRVAK